MFICRGTLELDQQQCKLLHLPQQKMNVKDQYISERPSLFSI